MELLESQDPVKRKLIETSDRHKRELQKEMKDIGDKSGRVLKNALIIGGALAVGYIIFSQVSSSKKKKKTIAPPKQTTPVEQEVEEQDDSPSLLARVGTQVMSQATFMLLEIAKEKLFDYLQSRKEKDQPAGQ